MKQITIEEALDLNLTERQVRMATSGRARKADYSRKELEQSMLEVFDLVGGVPRLAFWANKPENYGEFLKIVSKLLPKEAANGDDGKQVIYQTLVPASPLNKAAPPKTDDDVVDA